MKKLFVFIRKKPILAVLVLLAFISIACGITISACSENNFFDSNFLAACFSLAGVFLFFGALVYQIQEFELQRTIFEETMKAQKKTSEELEKQKEILLQQSTEQFLFNYITNYNNFKNRVEVQNKIEVFNLLLFDKMKNTYDYHNMTMSYDKLYGEGCLANFLIHASKGEFNDDKSGTLKSFIEFTYNIFDKIAELENKDVKKWGKVFLYNQLSSYEVFLIYFSQYFDNLNLTNEIFEWKNSTVYQLVGYLSKTNENFKKDKIDISKLIDDLNDFKRDTPPIELKKGML